MITGYKSHLPPWTYCSTLEYALPADRYQCCRPIYDYRRHFLACSAVVLFAQRMPLLCDRVLVCHPRITISPGVTGNVQWGGGWWWRVLPYTDVEWRVEYIMVFSETYDYISQYRRVFEDLNENGFAGFGFPFSSLSKVKSDFFCCLIGELGFLHCYLGEYSSTSWQKVLARGSEVEVEDGVCVDQPNFFSWYYKSWVRYGLTLLDIPPVWIW